jgi:hypothetical protein
MRIASAKSPSTSVLALVAPLLVVAEMPSSSRVLAKPPVPRAASPTLRPKRPRAVTSRDPGLQRRELQLLQLPGAHAGGGRHLAEPAGCVQGAPRHANQLPAPATASRPVMTVRTLPICR